MNTVLSIEEKFFDSSIKRYLIATHSITKKYIKAKIRSSKGKIKTTCYDKKHLQKVVYLLTILNNFTFIYWVILLHLFTDDINWFYSQNIWEVLSISAFKKM